MSDPIQVREQVAVAMEPDNPLAVFIAPEHLGFESPSNTIRSPVRTFLPG